MKYELNQVTEFFKSSIVPHIEKLGSVAFDGRQFLEAIGSDKVRCSLDIEELNETLSCNRVCSELGGVYTVYEFERNVYIAAVAHKVWSITRSFQHSRFAKPAKSVK